MSTTEKNTNTKKVEEKYETYLKTSSPDPKMELAKFSKNTEKSKKENTDE